MSTTTNPDNSESVPHPVDSATHACCDGIGRHIPDCPQHLDTRALFDSVAKSIRHAREDLADAVSQLPLPVTTTDPLPAGCAALFLAVRYLYKAESALDSAVERLSVDSGEKPLPRRSEAISSIEGSEGSAE
ncbi:hypothetical protein [Mycobacterium shigaense]|uniref:hypothetical protein n=1 Tax=Mycobacterium shigaense TaxID=722731 RepID=UPI002ADFB59A|nr:hypothetical protein [Mycobacterium shigaense]MEA1123902.1 hypothetical protein [Mycobacterium shigaense]